MKKNKRHIYEVLISFFSMVILSSIIRCVFFLWNRNFYNSDLRESSLIDLFFTGFAFDLLSLFVINSIFFIMAFWPFVKKTGSWHRVLTSLSFALPNLIYIIWNVADVQVFAQSGDRLTFTFMMGFLSDFFKQNFYIYSMIERWYFFIPVYVLLACYFYFLPNLKVLRHNQIKPLKTSFKFFIPICILCASVVFTASLKETTHIRVPSAFVFNSFAFSLYDKFFKKPLDEKLKKNLNPAEVLATVKHNHTNFKSQTKPQNVVLIILESMNVEFINSPYTPFLTSMTRKSLFFPNHFSNVRSSFRALGSVLLGTPYIEFEDIQKKWKGLGSLLSEEGYETFFFYPGSKRDILFDKMSLAGGIKHHLGSEEFLKKYPQAALSQWGAFDKDFFTFISEELSEKFDKKIRKPFFSVIFTNQSHAPFDIPKEYEKKYAHIDHKILKSVRYVDESVEHFFSLIKKQDWYKDTLFIITADHTQPPFYKNVKLLNSPLGRHRVSLLLHHPSDKLGKPQVSQKITQHADFYPTILSYLGLADKNKQYFGRSILEKPFSQGRVFLKEDNSFILVEGNYAYYYYLNEQKAQLFKWRDFLRTKPIENKKLLKQYGALTESYMKYYYLKKKALETKIKKPPLFTRPLLRDETPDLL